MQPVTLDLFLADNTITLKHSEKILAEDTFRWLDSKVSTKDDLWKFQQAVESHNHERDGFIKQFGQKLFQSLFTAPILKAWEVIQKQLPRDQHFHFRLRIDAESGRRWQQLPWEYMHDGQNWLLLKKYFSFCRLSPEADDKKFPKLTESLRMLIMVCAPKDLPEQMILNPRVEEDLIQQATMEAYHSGELEVCFTPNGQLATLDQWLQDFKPHIVHISAHGRFTGESGELLMTDAEENQQHVTHQEIIDVLAKADDLRLAVFSACQTAQTSVVSGLSDLGRRLTAEFGLGAVIAMNYAVRERSANAFLSKFYKEVVNGVPIHQAVSQARNINQLGRELGVPVLYMTNPDAFVINKQEFKSSQRESTLQLDSLDVKKNFVGRSVELHKLQTSLDPVNGDAQVAVIHGIGGIGKTALARRMAERSSYMFQGAIAIRMDPQKTILNILIEFRDFFRKLQLELTRNSFDQAVKTLGQLPENVSLDEQTRILLDTLREERLLIIFDNCEDILPGGFHLSKSHQDNEKEPEVNSPLLAFLGQMMVRCCGQNRFIFTSRNAFDLAGLTGNDNLRTRIKNTIRAIPVPVVEFGPRESFYLMEALPNLHGLSFRSEDNDSSPARVTKEALFEKIGGHPYYLKLFDQWIEQEGSVVAAFQAMPKLEKEMLRHTMLDRSIQHLSEKASALLYAGAVIRHPTPEEGWSYLIGDDRDCMPSVRSALEELVENGLMMAFPNLNYQLYSLPAKLALENLPNQKQNASQMRIADFWWLHWKESKDIHDPLIAWEYKRQAGDIVGATKIFGTICPWLELWGEWDLCRKLGLETLSQLNDNKLKAGILHNIGVIEEDQGRYELAQSHFRQSLAITKELGDRVGMAVLLHQLGNIDCTQGRYEDARVYYQQSMVIWEELGNRNETASSLYGLGNIDWLQGRYMKAQEHYQQSLKLFIELGEQRGVAATLQQLGAIKQQQGQYDSAQEYFQTSLVIEQVLKNQYGVASSLRGLGEIKFFQGHYQEAYDYFQQSLMILSQLGDQSGVANMLNHLGMIYRSQGRYEAAQDYYYKSLVIDKELGDRQGIADSLLNLGIIEELQRRYEAAQDYYQQSLLIFTELGAQRGVADALFQLGNIDYLKGRYSVAQKNYQQALMKEKELRDQKGIAKTLYQLGMIEQAQEQYSNAQDFYEQSLEIFKKLGFRSEVSLVLHQMGMIKRKQGQYQAAQDYYQRSLEIKEELGDRGGMAATLHQLGMIEQDQRRYNTAQGYYRQSLEIQKELANRSGVAKSLGQLGLLAEAQDDIIEAVKFSGQAFVIFSQISSPDQWISINVLIRLREKMVIDDFRTILSQSVGVENANVIIRIIEEIQSQNEKEQENKSED